MEKGSTLVEVLVALFIFALGLLGFCQLLMKSQNLVYEALLLTKGADLTLSLGESPIPAGWEKAIKLELPQGVSDLGKTQPIRVGWQCHSQWCQLML